MISQLLTNIRSTDKAKVAKSGGIAILISLSLQAAVYAGVAIPIWGQFAGVVVGLIAHALLPAKDQIIVDNAVDKVIDVVTNIPQTYSAPTDFPNAPPQETGQTTPNDLSNQVP